MLSHRAGFVTAIIQRRVLNRSGELELDGPFRFASGVRQAASLSLFFGYFRVEPTVEHPTSWQLVGLLLLFPQTVKHRVLSSTINGVTNRSNAFLGAVCNV